MSYQTTTIIDIVRKTNNTELCLPAIQRKYVWGPSQIEKLFDSIYLGYPIGTFLIWDVPARKINDYKFYSLLKDYDDRDGNFNPALPNPYAGNIFQSVLDGQQRITSLYLATQGSFTTKNPKARVNNPNAYTTRYIYFNFLAFQNSIRPELEMQHFKMLSEAEVVEDNKAGKNAWYKLSSLLREDWIENDEFNEDFARIELRTLITETQYESFFVDNSTEVNASNMRYFIKHVEKIANRIHKEQIISFYEIKNQTNLDTVAEIFIRINSGGSVLSKSDLLFSTVISSWQDGRDIIDRLIRDINTLGYDIDTDFVMRTSLYITGSKILFNVENFNTTIVELIINNFENENLNIDIRTSIYNTFLFLKNKLGLPEKTLKSKNVIIPIIYHLFKGGVLTDLSVVEIQKYLYISALQKVFGSHGDSLLAQLRSGVHFGSDLSNDFMLLNQDFNYNMLINGITDEQKRDLYDLNEDHLQKFLEKKKGDEAWLVLSLIYGQLQYDYNSYDQDHLHPASKVKRAVFPNNDFKTEIEPKRDAVPNLCFATPTDNRLRKRDYLLVDYVTNIIDNPEWFKSFNFIEPGINLDLTNFLDFYNLREAKLKQILADKLGVQLN
jgi:uncharacterized protein with ParB-like and HNH nuclease domain